ncbi:MAG: hypothetical protein RSD23_08175, partial [Ruthenibacterium sp.]
DALLVRDAEGIPPAIDQIADCLINRNYQTVSVYKDTMIHVVVQLRNIMQTVFCNESTEMFLRNLLNTQNILPIEDFSREVQMQSLKQIQILHAVTAGEFSETVQAAVAYIEYHYQEDLGLD